MKAIQLTDYQNFKIYFTFLLLWFSVQFNQVVEDYVAYILVVTIGILHGANDLLILSKSQTKQKKFLKNLTIYLTIIGVCVVLFWISSITAIFLFIVLSSYHFGEEHFSSKISLPFVTNTFLHLFYGLLVFSMLFFNHLEDVNEIMYQLSSYEFRAPLIDFVFVLSSLVVAILIAYLLLYKQVEKSVVIKEVFYLLLLFLVFKSTSLILGFAIYFIFWHSLPSILHQVTFLSGDLTKKSIISYAKSAAVYWIISIIGMLGVYYLIPDMNIFASVIFVILFAVTAPHIWVMYSMKS